MLSRNWSSNRVASSSVPKAMDASTWEASSKRVSWALAVVPVLASPTNASVTEIKPAQSCAAVRRHAHSDRLVLYDRRCSWCLDRFHQGKSWLRLDLPFGRTHFLFRTLGMLFPEAGSPPLATKG